MKKRIFALLLALAMIFSTLPLAVWAEEPATGDTEETENFSCNCFNDVPRGVEGKPEDYLRSVEPTCYSWGYDAYKHVHSVDGEEPCGGTFAHLTKAPVEHSWEHDDGQAATCDQEGWKAFDYCTFSKYCPKAYENVKAENIIGKHMSTVVDVPAQEPDCEHDGWEAYKACSVCGKELTEKVVKPSTGPHDWQKVEGSDTDIPEHCYDPNGYYMEECTKCHETRKVDVLAADLHLYKVIGSGEATCEKGHYDLLECTECDYQTRRYYDDALGHEKVADAGYAATCTKDGREDGWYCTRPECGYVEEGAVIPATGHKEKEIPVQEPTCGEVGYTAGVQCEVCKEWLSGHEEIPADDSKHVPNVTEGTVWRQPTCKDVGETVQVVCVKCDKILAYPEEIPVNADNHNYGEVVEVAATCTKAAYKKQTCELCGDVKEFDVTGEALGHDWKDVDAKEATHEEDGYTAHKECSRCGETDGKTVVEKHEPEFGKTYGYVKATCTEDAYWFGICQICDKQGVKYDEEHPALDHDWEEDLAYNGMYHWETCSRCDATRNKAMHVKGDLVAEGTEPTCTEVGKGATYSCADCGYEFLSLDIAPKGHTVEIVKGYDSTFYKTGLTNGEKCSVCGETLKKQDIIPIKTEEIEFVYKAVGINGTKNAVNSGYITLKIYMNVKTEIARLWAVDLDLSYSDKLTLVKVEGQILENGIKYTDLGPANAAHSVKLSQSRSANITDVATFEKGEYLFATLTFKVAADWYNDDAVINVVATDSKIVRGSQDNINALVCDFGTGTTIHVSRLGDKNCDGFIDSDDSLAFAQWFMTEKVENPDAYDALLDMDKDGTITIEDFNLLREAVVNNNQYLQIDKSGNIAE